MLANKSALLIIVLLVLSILVYNLLIESSNETKFSIDKILTINEEDTLLYGVSQICVDDSSYIFVADKFDYRVKKFTKTGSYINSVGQQGGCGECFNKGPAYISYFKDSSIIAVADYMTNEVKLFSSELEYIKTIIIYAPINDLIFDENGYLITARPPIANLGISIARMNQKGDIINSFDPVELTGNMILDMFSISYIKANRLIVLAYFYRNLIQVYDFNGKLIKEINIPGIREVAEFTEMSKNKSFSEKLPGKKVIKCFDTNKKDLIYIIINKLENKNEQVLYVIGVNGEIYGVVDINENISEIYVDEMNTLYTIEKKGTRVAKYASKFK